MKKQRLIFRLLPTLISISIPLIYFPSFSFAERNHKMTFGHARGAVFSKSKARSTLTAINRNLASIDGRNDVRCADVRFSLARNPSEYPRGLPKSVRSKRDYDAFRASGSKVNFVRRITWCDRSRPNGVAACASSPSHIVMVRRPRHLSNLLLHEVGHTVGLRHLPNRKNIMSSVIGPRSKKLFDFQCFALGGSTPDTAASVEGASSDQGTDALDGFQEEKIERAPPDKLTLKELTSGVWAEGVPVDDVLSISDRGLEQVRRWIREVETEFVANSVTILGLRGSVDDIKILENFLTKNVEVKSLDDRAEVEAAKLNVPLALGYFALRLKSREAARAILKYLNPNQNLKVSSGRTHDERYEFSQLLAAEATRALGIVSIGFPNASQLLTEQKFKQERGAFDMGVEYEDFFNSVEQMKKGVEKDGLFESLKP